MADPVFAVRPLAAGEVQRVIEVLPLHRFDQGNGFYLVAWDGDDAVGHVYVAAGNEIQDMFVRSDRRRRGIGLALTAAVEEVVLAGDDPFVCLEVSEDNDAAKALYRRCGFKPTGARPRRVTGTVHVRTGPIEVDATLESWEKPLGG